MTLSEGKSTPKQDKLKLIADYFGVSIDFLLTGKDHEFTEEMADLDAELIFMPLRIKECALKILKLTKEELDNIISLVDTKIKQKNQCKMRVINGFFHFLCCSWHYRHYYYFNLQEKKE